MPSTTLKKFRSEKLNFEIFRWLLQFFCNSSAFLVVNISREQQRAAEFIRNSWKISKELPKRILKPSGFSGRNSYLMECGHRREYGIHWHRHCIWLCKACHHHQRIDIHQFFHFLWKVELLNHDWNFNMFSGWHLVDILIHWPSKCLVRVTCLWRKMPMFQNKVITLMSLLNEQVA